MDDDTSIDIDETIYLSWCEHDIYVDAVSGAAICRICGEQVYVCDHMHAQKHFDHG